MGDFSVPGVLIGKVLQGAVNRVREHQDEDWKEEKRKRDAYVAQLSALLPFADTGADIEALNEDIARVVSLPREKKFTPKVIKTPSFVPPKGGGGAVGASGPQATPFDFREVMAALTGAGPQRSGMPDVPSAQGGPPESVGAIPPELMALLGSGAPPAPTGAPMVPPVGAGSLGATGAMTPPDTPKVMTPPGRNVPEPSPLVGTLPGTPSPVGASPTAGATPSLVGTPLPAVPPSPFMGIRERAELPYQLNEMYGMNRSGKPIGAAAGGKPLLTPKDVINAYDRGLRVIPDPSSPTGLAVAPLAAEDLSLINRGRVALTDAQTDLTEARTGDVSADNDRADRMMKLRREIEDLRAQSRGARDMRSFRATQLRLTNTIANSYRAAIKPFDEAQRNYDQLVLLLKNATGPSDYAAILSLVHNIDNTAAREGEVATIRAAASWRTRIEQAIDRAMEGDLMSPKVRAEFLQAAGSINSAIQAKRSRVDEQFATIAYEGELTPRAVGLPANATPAAGATPPPATAGSGSGTVERWERDPATGKLRRVK